MRKDDPILITGHRGLAGHALRDELLKQGFENLICWDRSFVDLTYLEQVRWAFSVYRPQWVFHCAARVGGIQANIDDPLGFCRDNLAIQDNVFSQADAYGVKKLVFLGSSCVYPQNCPQPMREEQLLTGPFTPEVEAYGLAKITGIKQCQWYHRQRGKTFVSVLPCNLFGPHDNFNPRTAHVIPGMMARMRKAKEEGTPAFLVWGHPAVRREFMFSPDLARILVEVMEKYDGVEPLNVGSGFELTMSDLSVCIKEVVGYTGQLKMNLDAPIGAGRKLMDNSRLDALVPVELTDFAIALRRTYESFLAGEGRK